MVQETCSDLQRLAAGVVLTIVHRKIVTDDRRVYAIIHGAQTCSFVVIPIESQRGGVEACPLGRAQVDLDGYHAGATSYRQI